MKNPTKKISLAALAMALLVTGISVAEEQNICAQLNLSGFNNSQIYTGFQTSDFGATVHTCAPGNGSSCSACDESIAFPKNIKNALCVPSSLTYSIDSACSTLLDAGASEDCSKNSTQCPSGFATVKPTCEYRTGDNSDYATWYWTVTYSNGLLSVSCSDWNYEGYTQ